MACTELEVKSLKETLQSKMKQKLVEDSNKFSATLQDAVKDKKYAVVKSLLANPKNPKIGYRVKPSSSQKPNCKQNTYQEYDTRIEALAEAICGKDIEMVKLLADPKCGVTNLSVKNSKNVDLFHLATDPQNFDPDIFDFLIPLWKNKQLNPEFDINLENSQGFTALFVACMENRLDILKRLHLAGADINKPSNDTPNFSPLHYAINKENKEVVEYLSKQPELDWDFIPNNKVYGFTPLCYAFNTENDTMIELILSAFPKERINNPVWRSSSATALTWIAKFGTPARMLRVIEKGGDVNHLASYKVDKADDDEDEYEEEFEYNSVITEVFFQKKRENSARMSNPKEMVEKIKILIEHGAKVSKIELMDAAEVDNLLIFSFLLSEYEKQNGKEAVYELVPELFFKNLLNQDEIILEGKVVDENECARFLLKDENYFLALQKDIQWILESLLSKNHHKSMKFLFKNAPKLVNKDLLQPLEVEGGNELTLLSVGQKISILAYAVLHGLPEMTTVLLEQNLDVHEKIKTNIGVQSLLFCAKKIENNQVFGILLQKLINLTANIKSLLFKEIMKKDYNKPKQIQKMIGDISNYLADIISHIGEAHQLIFEIKKFEKLHKMLKFSESELNSLSLGKLNLEAVNGQFSISISDLSLLFEDLVVNHPKFLELENSEQQKVFLMALKNKILADAKPILTPNLESKSDVKEIQEETDNPKLENKTPFDILNFDDDDTEEFFERNEGDISKLKNSIQRDVMLEILYGRKKADLYKEAQLNISKRLLEMASQVVHELAAAKTYYAQNPDKTFLENVNTNEKPDKSLNEAMALQASTINEFLGKRQKIADSILQKLQIEQKSYRYYASTEVLLEELRDQSVLTSDLEQLEKNKKRIDDLMGKSEYFLKCLVDDRNKRENEKDVSKKQEGSDEKTNNEAVFEKKSKSERVKEKRAKEKKKKKNGTKAICSSTAASLPEADISREVVKETPKEDSRAVEVNLDVTKERARETPKEDTKALEISLDVKTVSDKIQPPLPVNKQENKLKENQNNSKLSKGVTLDHKVAEESTAVIPKASQYPKPNAAFEKEVEFLIKTVTEVQDFDDLNKENDQYIQSPALYVCARDAMLGLACRSMDLIKSIEPVMATKFRNNIFHGLDKQLMPFSDHSIATQQSLYNDVKEMVSKFILPFLCVIRDQLPPEAARNKLKTNPLFKKIYDYNIVNDHETPDALMKKLDGHETIMKSYSTEKLGHSATIIQYGTGFAKACCGAIARELLNNQDKNEVFKNLVQSNKPRFLAHLNETNRLYRHPKPQAENTVANSRATKPTRNHQKLETLPQKTGPVVHAFMLSKNREANRLNDDALPQSKRPTDRSVARRIGSNSRMMAG